jgi:hypothetical protein
VWKERGGLMDLGKKVEERKKEGEGLMNEWYERSWGRGFWNVFKSRGKKQDEKGKNREEK